MSVTKQSKIATSLNKKVADNEYDRYDIGALSENVFYNYMQNNIKKQTSVKNVLDKLKSECLNEDTLNFEIKKPLTIKSSINTNNFIYNGTEERTLDLTNFLNNDTKWNNLGIALDSKNYKTIYTSGGAQVQDLSYNNGWIVTKRTQGTGYNYPKYSGSLTYNPTSLCKMILPEGVYFINYGIDVTNLYDSGLSNKEYTPNKGMISSKFKYFVDGNGKKLVDPGIVSATLCGKDRFQQLQQHYYKYYPTDTAAKSNQYFISYPAFTAPRVTGTTLNGSYTGRSFILTVPKQAEYHIVAMHWHVPYNNNIKQGTFTDSLKKLRIVCPISFWMQILNLAPPSKGYSSNITPGVIV